MRARRLGFGQVEGRSEPGEGFGGRVAPGALVDRDRGLPALGVADDDRRDLRLEPAGVDGRDRPPMALERKGVLIDPAHVVVGGDALGMSAHVAVLDRAPQPVEDGGVLYDPVAEAVAEARVRQEIRREIHALHATGDGDVRIARADLGGGQHDRLQPGAADPVDRRGAGRHGQAGAQGRLAGGRLADARLEDLAHEDLVDRRPVGQVRGRSTAARIATPPSSTAGVSTRRRRTCRSASAGR